MKKVTVEVRAGMVEIVEIPAGVSVHVIDYDVRDSQHQPVLEVWDGEEKKNWFLLAAKSVVEKVRRAFVVMFG